LIRKLSGNRIFVCAIVHGLLKVEKCKRISSLPMKLQVR